MTKTLEELQKERQQLFALQSMVNAWLTKNYEQIDAINVVEIEKTVENWWESPEKAHQLALANWGSGNTSKLAHEALRKYFTDHKPENIRYWDYQGWKMTEDYVPEYATLSLGFHREDTSDLEPIAQSIRDYAKIWGREDDPEFHVDIFEHTCSEHGVWFMQPFSLEVRKTTYGRTKTIEKFENLVELLEWVRYNVWYESDRDDYDFEDDDPYYRW